MVLMDPKTAGCSLVERVVTGLTFRETLSCFLTLRLLYCFYGAAADPFYIQIRICSTTTVFCWLSNFFPVGKIPQKSLNFLKQLLMLLLITLLFSTLLIVSLSVVMSVFNCFINHDPTITAANKVVCK